MKSGAKTPRGGSDTQIRGGGPSILPPSVPAFLAGLFREGCSCHRLGRASKSPPRAQKMFGVSQRGWEAPGVFFSPPPCLFLELFFQPVPFQGCLGDPGTSATTIPASPVPVCLSPASGGPPGPFSVGNKLSLVSPRAASSVGLRGKGGTAGTKRMGFRILGGQGEG